MGRLTGSSVYLDTNALVQFVENKNMILRSSLESVFVLGADILTSELTMAEVLVQPLRDDDVETVAAYEMPFSRGDLLQCLPVDRAAWRRSAELRAELDASTMTTIGGLT